MKQKMLLGIFSVVPLAFLAGCASASLKNSMRPVETIVHDRTGTGDDLSRGFSEAEVREETDLILAEPLTAESAVKVALLNNPSLKAALAGLGISKAELVQAGLLHNPVFSASIRKSSEEDKETNTEFEVKQDVMDVLFWPLRKQLADIRFKQAQYELAGKIVDLIKEVRIGFYNWQAATQMFSLRQEHFNAEETALEMARRQKEAGNINVLDLEQQKGIYYQAKTDLQRSDLECRIAAQLLRDLLGLADRDAEWSSPEALPDLPSEEFSLNELEEKALRDRIEVAMKRQELRAFKQSLALARWGVIPSIEGGFNWEKETDGSKLTGPVVEAEVPVFDHKQAERLRLNSQIEAGQKELEALKAQIRMEVRLAYDRLSSGKAMVETYLEAIPVRQKILKQTLYHYNYMLKGVYDLLRAKQEEIDTRRDHITALRDYWIARSELEHAVGMSLAVEQSKDRPNKEPNEVLMEHDHHQHGGGQ